MTLAQPVNEIFSTHHLDYLQRNAPDLSPPADFGHHLVPTEQILSRIVGVSSARERQDKPRLPENQKDMELPLPSQDMLTGLFGQNISFSFLIGSAGTEINLGFSVRPTQVVDAAGPVRNHGPQSEVLLSLLKSLYPSVSIENQKLIPRPVPVASVVLGVPSAKRNGDLEDTSPLDRLIRAMTGTRWQALVIAEPSPVPDTIALRNGLTNEMRRVMEHVQSRSDPSPLANQYVEFLTEMQKQYAVGLSVGLWRTAVYLMGDLQSYPRLSSVWRAVFSGEQSQGQPLRLFKADYARQLASSWILPSDRAERGPGTFQHPYKYQTMLTSKQLAAYVHFPTTETSGFKISHVPRFNVVPQSVQSDQQTISLGRVLSRENFTTDSRQQHRFDDLPNSAYRLSLRSLNKHVFVAGVTGAGKTTTIFQILKEVWTLRIPFLVIEPAKTEYRELLRHREIGLDLQIFTLGDERISPFRLNPFEVLPGTTIAKHIDLLRSLFSASFGLWTPLPQILEECLYAIYREKGWDITNDLNHRLINGGVNREDSAAFPTLSDLLAKIDEVTSRLEWDAEAVARIRGSLRDRLRTLINGGRGRMLDVSTSLPASVIFERPTILELEPMGDDDEKAFMMGLLLIRLMEWRRGQEDGPQFHGKLRHVLVFEEAHRLLSNVPSNAEQGAANPRAKAVETFTNLLSEIRSYGQAVIVADQVPVKLSPDVIKNTNLKIAHRVVDLEDRKLLAGSMVMNDEQAVAIAKLLPGCAAVYAEGDDGPLILQINPGPEPRPAKPEDHEIRGHFVSTILNANPNLFTRHYGCTSLDSQSSNACDAAQELVARPVFKEYFSRLVLSLVNDKTALKRLWSTIETQIIAAVGPTIAKSDVERCVISMAAEWYTFRRGFQSGWSYSDTRELRDALHAVLIAQVQDHEVELLIETFQQRFVKLHMLETLPYAKCEQICQTKNLCLYRRPVSEAKESRDFREQWYDSNPFAFDEPIKASWQVCLRLAERLVEWGKPQEESIRRIGLCYGQMMFDASAIDVFPALRDLALERLVEEAAVPLENL